MAGEMSHRASRVLRLRTSIWERSPWAKLLISIQHGISTALITEHIMSVPSKYDEHSATSSLAMRATTRSFLRGIRGFRPPKHRFPSRRDLWERGAVWHLAVPDRRTATRTPSTVTRMPPTC